MRLFHTPSCVPKLAFFGEFGKNIAYTCWFFGEFGSDIAHTCWFFGDFHQHIGASIRNSSALAELFSLLFHNLPIRRFHIVIFIK